MEKFINCKSQVLADLTADLSFLDKRYLNNLVLLADYFVSCPFNFPVPDNINNLTKRFWKEYNLLCLEFFGDEYEKDSKMDIWLKEQGENSKPYNLKSCWKKIISDNCIDVSLKYFETSLEHFGNHDFTNAIKFIDKSLQYLQHEPDWKWLFKFRAELKLEAGYLQEAWEDINLINETKDQDYDYYFIRGECYLTSSNYNEAMADYTKSIELKPTGRSLAARATIRKTLGDYDGAIDDISKAIEMEINRAINYELRADIWRVKGLYDNAFDDLSSAYLLDSSEERYFNDLTDLALVTGRSHDFEIIKKRAEIKGKQKLKNDRPLEYNELFPSEMPTAKEDEIFDDQVKELLQSLHID